MNAWKPDDAGPWGSWGEQRLRRLRRPLLESRPGWDCLRPPGGRLNYANRGESSQSESASARVLAMP